MTHMKINILWIVLLSTACQNDKKISEIEMKLTALEKKFSAKEINNTICFNEKTNLQKLLIDKTQDLKDCSSYIIFKGTHEEKAISYDLIDILKSGCVGHLKMNREKYVTPEPKGKFEILDSAVKTDYASWGNLLIRPVKKYIVPPNYIRDNNIDLSIDSYNINHPPTVVLGKMYEFNREFSGGTLTKGVYNFKYNVVKNETQQLVVTLEGDTSQKWNHVPGGVNIDFRLTCTCKTIEEMDAISAKNARKPIKDK